MAKNYRDNFDYSEAIANSTSKAERDRLLAERQNKIDAEGLTGRVADNSAVSTWTKGYRPYYVASASSASKAAQENAERVSSLYDAAEKARLERFEAARTRIRQQLDANLSSIDSDYASAVRQAGISARQSALRNEEKLALLGLNMGAKTGAATSGMAESSRIAVDNQYRGDLNSLSQSRLAARSAAEAEAYERALARWKTTGYVQKADAAVLGVPAGTPTADVSYKNASLALQRWKAGYSG